MFQLLRGTSALSLLPRAAMLALIMGAVAFPVAVFAQSSASIQPINSATLTNKVALTVSLTASCGPFVNPANSGFTSLSVTQAVGQHVAESAGTGQIDCDGTAHTTTINMTVLASGAPFHDGPAVANADILGCGVDPVSGIGSCVNASTSGTIRLVNK
jgi:hypothetical protein